MSSNVFTFFFFWWVLQHCTGFARLVWGRLGVHRAFIYSNWFVCSVCLCSLLPRLTLLLSFVDILHCLPRWFVTSHQDKWQTNDESFVTSLVSCDVSFVCHFKEITWQIDLWQIDLWQIDLWQIDLWQIDLWQIDLWQIDLWQTDLWQIDLWQMTMWQVICHKSICQVICHERDKLTCDKLTDKSFVTSQFVKSFVTWCVTSHQDKWQANDESFVTSWRHLTCDKWLVICHERDKLTCDKLTDKSFVTWFVTSHQDKWQANDESFVTSWRRLTCDKWLVICRTSMTCHLSY